MRILPLGGVYVGFLGFLNKKKGDKKADKPQMPLPPPKVGDAEAELPAFPEEQKTEELKLPEIPDLTEQPLPSGPIETEIKQMPSIPHIPIPPEVAPPKELRLPELTKPEVAVKPAEEQPEEVYKYTPPIPPIPEMHKELPPANFTGEIFIQGQDFRELIEDLDGLIAMYREKEARVEKDFGKLEEMQHNKLINTVEDIQRKIVLTEKVIFE